MSNLYQEAIVLEPLDADIDKAGTKSDHRIVLARPINAINNKSGRQTHKIKFRPFPESGLLKMKEWFIEENWTDVFEAKDTHEKAEVFQNKLLEKLQDIFPEKTKNVQSDDSPWMTQKLKKMDRRRKRVYRRERKSEKWSTLNKQFKAEVNLIFINKLWLS